MGHFLPFYSLMIWEIKSFKKWKNPWKYYPFTHVYHNWSSYRIWFLKYKVQLTEYFVILGHFSVLSHPPSLPPQQLGKLKYWKIEKKNTWRYYFTTRDECNFYFSFWANFCPFTHLTIQKIKMKKVLGDIIILHMCFKN